MLMHESNLIFLGTAGDTNTVNKQMRSSGGMILVHNNNQIHIDPGPGTLIQYKRIGLNPRNTIALIVTNNDIGHANDTNAIVSAMTHDGLDNRGVLIGAKSIIEGTETEHPVLWKRYRNYLERNIILRPDERVGINEVDIKAIPSKSNDETGIGLRITTGKFTVVYTSDTAYNPKVASNYEQTDILIIKSVYPFHDDVTDKLNCTQIVKIIQDVNPNLVILTGFGVKMLNSDPIYIAREIHNITGVQVIAAHDGLVINPMSYTGNTPKSFSDF